MSRNQKVTITCSCCGNEKRDSEYYSSNSSFHKATKKLHVCKDCVWNEIDENDTDTWKEVLRKIDRPFLTHLYQSAVDEAKKEGKSIFGIYMKNLGMRQNRTLTWHDSNYTEVKDIISNISLEDILKEEYDITQEDMNEMIKFWGKGFEIDNYLWLQTEYEDFVNRYECDSKGMELLIKQICLTQLDIETRRANAEKVDQQVKTLQDLLGSSNLKPAQETGANAVEQETFGTLIKKFEKEHPIPEPDEKWKDVDGIGKYIRTFFLGHMAKAIGIENKFQDEYENELEKYTVKQEDGDE